MTVDFKKLAAPFPPHKVSWRVGQVTKADKNKASALCYIDARDVQNRLDEVCGPDGWQTAYHETAKGRLICTLSILCGDVWIAKSDGAGDTAVEGEKGAISDALKRAAVCWGIGRYLYDIDMQWVKVDDWKKILPSEFAKLERALPGSKIADAAEEVAPASKLDEAKGGGKPTASATPPADPDAVKALAASLKNALKSAKNEDDIDMILTDIRFDEIKGASKAAYDHLIKVADIQRQIVTGGAP